MLPPACECFVSITLCMLCTKPFSLQVPKFVKWLHIAACFCNEFGSESKLTAAHTLQLLLHEKQGNQCPACSQRPMCSCLDDQYPVQSLLLQLFLSAALCISPYRHESTILNTTARALCGLPSHHSPPSLCRKSVTAAPGDRQDPLRSLSVH